MSDEANLHHHPSSPSTSDRTFFIVNGVVSFLAVSLLGWLLLFHRGLQGAQLNLRFLPPFNASLNAVAALLLVAGRVAIKRRRLKAHRHLMLWAFIFSSCFLIGYLTYHAVHGDTKFGGTGPARLAYLAILASHVVLSICVVPLAQAAFWFARKGDFHRHTQVARWLHPIWLYVSVTGVAVFLMLRPYYPG